MKIAQPDFKTLVEKIEKLKKSGEIDLLMEEDLSIAVMNLVSLEEHFFFTSQKTKKDEYLDWLNQIRAIRKEMMNKLLPKEQHEGETWCITKHLLAATMRLIEVGTKLQGDNKIKQTVLYVLPEDDTEGYEMFTLEGDTLTDLGENEIDDEEDIAGLSKVLEFLKEELNRAEQPKPTG